MPWTDNPHTRSYLFPFIVARSDSSLDCPLPFLRPAQFCQLHALDCVTETFLDILAESRFYCSTRSRDSYRHEDDDQQVTKTRSATMGARTTTTVFVNNTTHSVKMQVGNNHFFSDLTSIQQGGEFKLDVNVNDTYREFAVSRAGSRKKMIVSSDDCCEFQCITIQEVADGGIDLVRQPRERVRSTASASKTPS